MSRPVHDPVLPALIGQVDLDSRVGSCRTHLLRKQPVEQILNIGIISCCSPKRGGAFAPRLIRGRAVVKMTRTMLIAVLGLTGPIGGLAGKVCARAAGAGPWRSGSRPRSGRCWCRRASPVMAARRPAEGSGSARGMSWSGAAIAGRRSSPTSPGEPADPGDRAWRRGAEDAPGEEAARRRPSRPSPAGLRKGARGPKPARQATTETAAAPPRHWAFEPVKPVAPPPDPTGWSVHPIDRFIAARHRPPAFAPSPTRTGER